MIIAFALASNNFLKCQKNKMSNLLFAFCSSVSCLEMIQITSSVVHERKLLFRTLAETRFSHNSIYLSVGSLQELVESIASKCSLMSKHAVDGSCLNCLCLFTGFHDCFNIDTRNHRIIKGPRQTQFGYTVQQHMAGGQKW